MPRPLDALCLAGCLFVQPALALEVPYVPTPERVVQKMLQVAKVGPKDVVYDLGSGDGRIVIAAAKRRARPGSRATSNSASRTSSRRTSAKRRW
jgi:hypothetical protein